MFEHSVYSFVVAPLNAIILFRTFVPHPIDPRDMTQTSDVWRCFEKIKEEKKAKCILCLRKLAYHRGTSNLREHLVKIQI